MLPSDKIVGMDNYGPMYEQVMRVLLAVWAYTNVIAKNNIVLLKTWSFESLPEAFTLVCAALRGRLRIKNLCRS